MPLFCWMSCVLYLFSSAAICLSTLSQGVLTASLHSLSFISLLPQHILSPNQIVAVICFSLPGNTDYIICSTKIDYPDWDLIWDQTQMLLFSHNNINGSPSCKMCLIGADWSSRGRDYCDRVRLLWPCPLNGDGVGWQGECNCAIPPNPRGEIQQSEGPGAA